MWVYNVWRREKHGTSKNKKTGGDASSFAKASTFAKATVDESEDKEAAAGNPPSPRLWWTKGRDEAADEGRCREGRSASVCAGGGQSSAESILARGPKLIDSGALIYGFYLRFTADFFALTDSRLSIGKKAIEGRHYR